MQTIIVVILIIAPTLLDLTVQFIIHHRTVKRIQACPYCPHITEELDEK